MTNNTTFFELPTIDGMLSPQGCVEAIKFHATNMSADQSSPMVNHGRLESLRSLLDLFNQYNNEFIKIRDMRG